MLITVTSLAGCGFITGHELPAQAPVTRQVAVESYQPAIEAASQWLSEHRASAGLPSYSVAVSVDGKLVWSEAVGWSDVASRTPATPQTVYRIGSTSKAVTATLTARLVDEGKVDIDAPIVRYYPDLPEHWQPLTLRQLHSHTAGLPGYENNGDWVGLLHSWVLWRHYDDVTEALTQFDGSDLLYPPGEDYYYSSFDVVLASAVLQSAMDVSFAELLAEKVFKPVGMTSTGPDGSQPDGIATFYDRWGDRVAPWRSVDLSNKIASGGLVATSTDLVRLGNHWLDPNFIRPSTRETFWTPQPIAEGKPNPDDYAIGWRTAIQYSEWYQGELRVAHHGGVSKGAMSLLIVYPDLNIVIALNTNALADSFAVFSRPSASIAALFYQHRKNS